MLQLRNGQQQLNGIKPAAGRIPAGSSKPSADAANPASSGNYFTDNAIRRRYNAANRWIYSISKTVHPAGINQGFFPPNSSSTGTADSFKNNAVGIFRSASDRAAFRTGETDN